MDFELLEDSRVLLLWFSVNYKCIIPQVSPVGTGAGCEDPMTKWSAIYPHLNTITRSFIVSCLAVSMGFTAADSTIKYLGKTVPILNMYRLLSCHCSLTIEYNKIDLSLT